ncbi:MFS transporter [Lysinibacter cavernae]|uniref:MFS family permease n=1 Tax=Lysinibacter cavernae TaxID=1640652 RepID=A0A7X5R2L7_9MICO|nr:MFS transporter [Lysinibacter cavernae]NIH54540.1 MFS family permease [Lysinibacter cavernae]
MSTTTPSLSRPAAIKPPRNEAKRAAVAAFLGGMLEYYDFFIYASASALVFGVVFFPENGAAGTFMSLATFGVAYVARPFGAIVLGHFGDKIGRKNVLVFSLMLMGGATFLIGCLPSYDSIGIWAPILLVVLRLLQGLSAGGETAGASSLTIEHAPAKKRAFYGSWTMNGIAAGIILASLTFIPVAAMPDEQLYSWGWRIPFWASIIVLVVAYLVRRTLAEPEIFEETKEKDDTAKIPLFELFRYHWVSVIRLALCALFTVVNSIVSVFALNYATGSVGIEKPFMLTVAIGANVVAILFQTLGGVWADLFGRKPVFIIGTLGCSVTIFFYFQAISSGNHVLIVLMSLLMTGLFYSLANGIYPAFFSEMFSVKVRYSGMAVGLQIGLIVAGFSPAIASLLVGEDTTNWLPVAIFVSVVCAISAIAAMTAKETFNLPLNALGLRKGETLPVEQSVVDAAKDKAPAPASVR